VGGERENDKGQVRVGVRERERERERTTKVSWRGRERTTKVRWRGGRENDQGQEGRMPGLRALLSKGEGL
jgi:hypothetical protein